MKSILVDAYNTFVTDDWINQEMFKMLEEFENKKIILTNANAEKQVEFWLVDLPYDLFTLNFDPLKTDPKFYEIFLEKNSLSKDDVIYFEHNLEAVESARSFWINTYHYNHIEKDISSLKDFLYNNL